MEPLLLLLAHPPGSAPSQEKGAPNPPSLCTFRERLLHAGCRAGGLGLHPDAPLPALLLGTPSVPPCFAIWKHLPPGLGEVTELMFAKCLEGAWLRGLCSHFPLDPFPIQQPIPTRLCSPRPFPQLVRSLVEMVDSSEGRPCRSGCQLLLEVLREKRALPCWGVGVHIPAPGSSSPPECPAWAHLTSCWRPCPLPCETAGHPHLTADWVIS